MIPPPTYTATIFVMAAAGTAGACSPPNRHSGYGISYGATVAHDGLVTCRYTAIAESGFDCADGNIAAR